MRFGVFQFIVLLLSVGISAAVITVIVMAITRKPKKTCPGCGKSVAATSGFCPYCGKSLRASASVVTFRAPVSAVCPACGAIMPEGVRFCPECGRAAGEATGPMDPGGSFFREDAGDREEIPPADPAEAFDPPPFMTEGTVDPDPGEKTVKIRPRRVPFAEAEEPPVYPDPDEEEPTPPPVYPREAPGRAGRPKPASAAFSMPDDSDL